MLEDDPRLSRTFLFLALLPVVLFGAGCGSSTGSPIVGRDGGRPDGSAMDGCVAPCPDDAGHGADGGPADGGSVDGSSVDGGSADGGPADGGSADGGAPDGGAPDGATGTRCGLSRCDLGEVCCGDGSGGCNCEPQGVPCPAAPTACTFCSEGTCVVSLPTTCEEPTGTVGNGCCACDADGFCTQYCICASPDTPIATPEGKRPIADLRPGDVVYSVHGQQIVPVPIVRASRTAARNHHVVRLTTAEGAVLEISGPHPTADGRVFADLRVGDTIDGARITSVEIIPYVHSHTYDILPASDTGTYFADGVRIGSTLRR